MNENALTTSGSRTFAGVITVTWTPDSAEPKLLVVISSGGSTLKYLTYDGTGKLSFDVSQGGGTVKTNGTFSALFDAGGKSGTLTADEFNWLINDQEGSYKGDIGRW